MADIAHQIVLRYGVKAPYLEVAQEIERVIDCAFDGGEFNDVTFMSSIVSYDEPTSTKQPQQPKPASLNTEKKEKNQPSNPQKPNMITKLCNYLKTNYTFRYNILTNKSEMKREGEEDYIVIGKREKNTIVLDAQQAGLNCWDKDVERIIESTGTPTYHPFTNYFDQLPKWDGKDRVSELAKRVSEKEVWVSGFHRWMLSATAQWMNIGGVDARANCVAPLLISTEQGWGKSTFCRILLPQELQEHYTENFNLAKESDCDKELGRYGIINLDEFDKFSANKMPKLKNLMQKQALHVRHAYERNDTNLHRIASFIGTSNRRDLLSDPTGSRRFLCVELEKPIDCQTPIEYPQLYAQLKEELLRGERTYFTKEEERKIQLNNRPYYSSVPELEAFHRHYRMASQTDEGAEFMTSSEIYKRLQRSERAVMRGATANRFARLLTELGEKVHTNLGNGYYVKLKD
jgi:predicted P-loop ATPase